MKPARMEAAVATEARQAARVRLYNFFFGREFALGATIGAMAKFAHVTNRHKISYKLNV